MYIGIVTCGDFESEVIEELRIVENGIFFAAQELMQGRAKVLTDNPVPFRMRGDSLLLGNLYCGHCGSRITLSSARSSYKRKDGTTTYSPYRAVLKCYNKSRGMGCTGQTQYVLQKINDLEGLCKFYDEWSKKME